jgi:dephospho-CoA kinase
MLRVGVTGGIGSGKSTVCNVFRCLDIPVFNADKEGRHFLDEDEVVKEQIINIFGEKVLTNDKLDRNAIARIVFNDREKLAQLNAVIHPAVRKKFNIWADKQKSPYVINEAAILFETGSYKLLDYVILVIAPESLRIRRIAQRDGMGEDEIKVRMKNQWGDEEKMKLTSFVIDNNDIKPLLPQVMELHHKLISLVK